MFPAPFLRMSNAKTIEYEYILPAPFFLNLHHVIQQVIEHYHVFCIHDLFTSHDYNRFPIMPRQSGLATFVYLKLEQSH